MKKIMSLSVAPGVKFNSFEVKNDEVIIKNVPVDYNSAGKEERLSCNLIVSLHYNKTEYINNVVLTANNNTNILFAGCESSEVDGEVTINLYIWGYFSCSDKETINEKFSDETQRIFLSILNEWNQYEIYIDGRDVYLKFSDEFYHKLVTEKLNYNKGKEECEQSEQYIPWGLVKCLYTYATFPLDWVVDKSIVSLDEILKLIAPEQQHYNKALDYELKGMYNEAKKILIHNFIDLYKGYDERENCFESFVELVDKIKKQRKSESKINYRKTLLLDAFDTLLDAEIEYRQKKQLDSVSCSGLIVKYGKSIESLLKACVFRPIEDEEIVVQYEENKEYYDGLKRKIKKYIKQLKSSNTDNKDEQVENKKEVLPESIMDIKKEIKSYIEGLKDRKKPFYMNVFLTKITKQKKNDKEFFQDITLGNFPYIIEDRYIEKLVYPYIVSLLKDGNASGDKIDVEIETLMKKVFCNYFLNNIMRTRIGDTSTVVQSDRFKRWVLESKILQSKRIKTISEYRNGEAHGGTDNTIDTVREMRYLIFGDIIMFEDMNLDRALKNRLCSQTLARESSLLWKILFNNLKYLDAIIDDNKHCNKQLTNPE